MLDIYTFFEERQCEVARVRREPDFAAEPPQSGRCRPTRHAVSVRRRRRRVPTYHTASRCSSEGDDDTSEDDIGRTTAIFYSSGIKSHRRSSVCLQHRLRLVNIACLIGPDRSGKTSLLFQYAYNYAQTHENESVYLVTSSRDRLRERPPLLFQNYPPPQPSILARVHIRYLTSDEELRRFALNMHRLTNVGLLLVDDLYSFFSSDSPDPGVFVTRTLAYLHDGARCLQTYRSSRDSDPFLCILSDSARYGLATEALLQRYTDCILLLHGHHSPFHLSAYWLAGGVLVEARRKGRALPDVHYELSAAEGARVLELVPNRMLTSPLPTAPNTSPTLSTRSAELDDRGSSLMLGYEDDEGDEEGRDDSLDEIACSPTI